MELKELVQIDGVHRVVEKTTTNYRKTGEPQTSNRITLWCDDVNNLDEARELIKRIRMATNVRQLTKSNHEDSDLIFDGKLGLVNIRIWIGIPQKDAVKILSEYYKCTILVNKKRKSYESTEVACSVEKH